MMSIEYEMQITRLKALVKELADAGQDVIDWYTRDEAPEIRPVLVPLARAVAKAKFQP